MESNIGVSGFGQNDRSHRKVDPPAHARNIAICGWALPTLGIAYLIMLCKMTGCIVRSDDLVLCTEFALPGFFLWLAGFPCTLMAWVYYKKFGKKIFPHAMAGTTINFLFFIALGLGILVLAVYATSMSY